MNNPFASSEEEEEEEEEESLLFLRQHLFLAPLHTSIHPTHLYIPHTYCTSHTHHIQRKFKIKKHKNKI